MSLVATLTQSLRARYPNNLDQNERRISQYGAWEFAKADTNRSGGILSPEVISLAKKSFGNQVTIPVLDARTVTIGNARSCTIADSENTSALVNLNFATFAFGFTMTPAQHWNNDIAYQRDYDVKLEQYLLQLAILLDTNSVTALETNKNVFAGDLAEYYALTGSSLQVPDDEKEDFYNQVSAIMQTMDFPGRTHVITNPQGMPLVNRIAAQGGSNSINEQFQLGGYEWHTTNRIANAAGIRSTGYLVKEGSLAVVNRNDPDAIIGSSVGTQMQWGEIDMPLVNLRMGTFYREDCSDRSALHAGTTGLTRAKKESFEFSTDIAWITAYNSNTATRYSPIQKFEIAAPA